MKYQYKSVIEVKIRNQSYHNARAGREPGDAELDADVITVVGAGPLPEAHAPAAHFPAMPRCFQQTMIMPSCACKQMSLDTSVAR